VIYFLKTSDSGPIKIGQTAQMGIRLNQHRIKSGGSVRVIGVMKGGRRTEREIHARFDHLRISKEELFRQDKELLDFISEATVPWSGTKAERGLPVKFSPDLVTKAKYIAMQRGASVEDLLNEWLRPLVEQEFREAGRELLM
jgi:hypothetical protein